MRIRLVDMKVEFIMMKVEFIMMKVEFIMVRVNLPSMRRRDLGARKAIVIIAQSPLHSS